MTENTFLEVRIGSSIAIYLLTGVKIVGIMEGSDLDAVFLRSHGARASETMMIYKHGISTIRRNAPSIDSES